MCKNKKPVQKSGQEQILKRLKYVFETTDVPNSPTPPPKQCRKMLNATCDESNTYISEK